MAIAYLDKQQNTQIYYEIHVYLLLYSEGQQKHYCLISNLNQLLSNQSKPPIVYWGGNAFDKLLETKL